MQERKNTGTQKVLGWQKKEKKNTIFVGFRPGNSASVLVELHKHE